MPKSDDNKPVSIRISETTKAALKEIAQNDRRSLNSLISIILDDYVAEHSRKNKPAKK